MSAAQLIGGVIILGAPGVVIGWWAARLRQHRVDWMANKIKMRNARSDFWRRLFGPIGYGIAIILILAALAIYGGKK